MRLAVTGHRPPKIGGYDPNSLLRYAIRTQMKEEIEKLSPTLGISGMALGVDQDFADLCIELGIPFIAAVPFEGQERMWPEESRKRFHQLLDAAQSIEVICQGTYAPWKMQKRNEWMVDHADHLLAVWDGSPGGTANCVAYAKQVKIPITRINPKGSDASETR